MLHQDSQICVEPLQQLLEISSFPPADSVMEWKPITKLCPQSCRAFIVDLSGAADPVNNRGYPMSTSFCPPTLIFTVKSSKWLLFQPTLLTSLNRKRFGGFAYLATHRIHPCIISDSLSLLLQNKRGFLLWEFQFFYQLSGYEIVHSTTIY